VKTAASIVFILALIYLVLLMLRVLISWAVVFNRDWRPKGAVAAVAEVVFVVTDPPIKALRKVLKPVRLGVVQLDLSIVVVSLALSLVMVGAYRLVLR
jgi:YggT family protein